MTGMRQEFEAGPRSFDEIIGQAHVVEALRERVRAGGAPTGLILHGARGMGKRTFTRLYAKSVRCETPNALGTCCDRCDACEAFEQNSTWGCIEVNARDGNADDHAKAIVASAGGALLAEGFGEKRVVIITDVDAYEPTVFDRFLKILEEGSVPLVLTASDLKRVRLAVQSRCMIYRLRPLDPDHACALLERRLSPAVIADERVCDIILAAANGLPGKLSAIATRLADLPAPTLNAVRAALGLDWTGAMFAYWQNMLGAEEPRAELLVPPMATSRLPGVDEVDERLRRVRVFLNHLRLYGFEQDIIKFGWSEPAFLHIDETMWPKLGALLRGWAVAQRVPASQLWRTLAEHWLSTDHTDADGLELAGQVTRRLVVGRKPLRSHLPR